VDYGIGKTSKMLLDLSLKSGPAAEHTIRSTLLPIIQAAKEGDEEAQMKLEEIERAGETGGLKGATEALKAYGGGS